MQEDCKHVGIGIGIAKTIFTLLFFQIVAYIISVWISGVLGIFFVPYTVANIIIKYFQYGDYIFELMSLERGAQLGGGKVG